MPNLLPNKDNAKCKGLGCEKREHCCRFLRPAADDLQRWVGYDGLYRGQDRCAGYQIHWVTGIPGWDK